METTQSTTDIGMMGQQSPKSIYTVFVLGLCKEFFSVIDGLDEKRIDLKTSALIAFVPDSTVRETLWKKYRTVRDKENVQTASVLIVGDVITHLSDVLEWSDSSNGGWI